MLENLKRKDWPVFLAVVMTLLLGLPAMAQADGDSVSIGVGLSTVDADTIAGAIKGLALGAAALIGVIALGALLWVGVRQIGGHTERQRAEAKEHLIDIFKGLGIAGLASMIVGFVAWLIQQNVK